MGLGTGILQKSWFFPVGFLWRRKEATTKVLRKKGKFENRENAVIQHLQFNC